MAGGDNLATAIGDFLQDAETGRRYSRDELRELRGALAHIDSELGTMDLDEVGADDVRRVLDGLRRAGLPPARVRAVVSALRSVYAHAIDRGLVESSPLLGVTADDGTEPRPGEARTPTEAILALGDYAVSLVVRTLVIAFVLVAAGLVLALL
jgi:site-specific recombinase XerC